MNFLEIKKGSCLEYFREGGILRTVDANQYLGEYDF